MSIERAGSKAEALRLLDANRVFALELDYETGWQDAVELGRLGDKRGIKVQYRGQESVAVRSRDALLAGLGKPKTTFRQRNLYCQFDLGLLADHELEQLEAKATRLGDYILAGHLLREADSIWS
ncbi:MULTISPECIES: PHA-granule associated protein 4 [unclassified Cupriavidus]|uniref:PHA-granule associated protein 4 n=1 Tax=unclassified Cupriavidus TaxID=2640874 RepID=UPI0010F54F07|nr:MULTISPECIES: PHA-granule associated protein 4 [unclassified Cupriavidus]MWL90713.1 PHA-granule associated protein 4 [Cupriavidus sp. SW-Y-13]